ncbi:MAG TPA: extracellular solute-binding protein [Sphingobium sp.]
MAGQRSDHARSRRSGLLRSALAGLAAIGLLATLGRTADRPAGVPVAKSPIISTPKRAIDDGVSPYTPTTVDANGVTCSYGYAVWGKLKYGPDFKHFDYVNPAAPKGGTYRYAMEQASFDTVSQFSLLGVFPLSLLYFHDTLMRQSSDEPASYYGLIADRVCFAKDLSWFEFHINPKARWNDGAHLTADDVMFTIQKAKTTIGVIQRRIDQAVDHFARTGPRTVKVYLTQKNNPILPTVLTGMQILPKHYYEKHDLLATTLEPPVNSGPYQFGRISPGRWIEFVRNRTYWAADLPVNKGRFNFDVIRQDFYRDQLVANEAFLAGNEDAKAESNASNWVSENRLPPFRAGEIKRTQVRYMQPAWFLGVMLNARRAPLDNRRLRQALLLCYDFEWVNRVLLGNRHGRLTSIFPNGDFEAHGLPTPGELKLLEPYRADLPPELFTQPLSLPKGGNWTNRRANLLKAARLLREGGFKTAGGRLTDPKTGKPVVLRLLAYSALIDRQLSLFIENARRLGIEIRFRNVDTAQMRSMMRTYDYDILAPARQLATSSTPGVGIIQMWSSKAADTPQQLNFPGAKHPAIDAMVMAVVNAKDRDSVVNAMRALDRAVQWGYYVIPMQHLYPAPLGYLPVSYWDRFGRPAKEPTYNFNVMTLDTWWVDKTREARLRHRRIVQ